MDHTASTGDFSKQAQDLADKAANKIQGGIQDSQRAVNRAGDQISSKADELRGDAQPLLKKAAKQANAFAQSVGDARRKARDAASQASESVIAYAKENPVKAILIATASGAVLATLFHAIFRSRD